MHRRGEKRLVVWKKKRKLYSRRGVALRLSLLVIEDEFVAVEQSPEDVFEGGRFVAAVVSGDLAGSVQFSLHRLTRKRGEEQVFYFLFKFELTFGDALQETFVLAADRPPH